MLRCFGENSFEEIVFLPHCRSVPESFGIAHAGLKFRIRDQTANGLADMGSLLGVFARRPQGFKGTANFLAGRQRVCIRFYSTGLTAEPFMGATRLGDAFQEFHRETVYPRSRCWSS